MSEFLQDVSGSTTKFDSLEVVRYNTPQEILAAHWETPWDELKESTMGGFDPDSGEESECPFDKIVEGMEATGIWAYVSLPKNQLHIWVKDGAPLDNLMFVLGHELGHLSGIPIKEDDSQESQLAEEARADEYGAATQKAFLIAQELGRL